MSEFTVEAVSNYLLRNPKFVEEWIVKNLPIEKMRELIEEKVLAKPSGLLSEHKDSHTDKLFHETVAGKAAKAAKNSMSLQQRRTSLKNMDQGQLFLELVKDLSTDLDVNILCHKILINVCILTHGDRASLFLVRGAANNKYLVSRLFDVTQGSSVTETVKTEHDRFVVPFGKGIVGSVAVKKQTLNIKNAYQDERFNKDIDQQTGYKTMNLLCHPILNNDGNVIGVAQIINKCGGKMPFSTEDEEVLKNFLVFCGLGLTNAHLFEKTLKEFKKNQMLLQLARGILTAHSNWEDLFKRVLNNACSCVPASRCCIYQTYTNNEDSKSKEIFKNVYQVSIDGKGNKTIIVPEKDYLKNSFTAKSAREVYKMKRVQRYEVSLEDRQKNRLITDVDGYRITNVLTAPILGDEVSVIGAFQFVNRIRGQFTNSDYTLIETLAAYCALGFQNCQNYEDIERLMAKQKVHMEVLSFHASADHEETEKLVKANIDSGDVHVFRMLDWDFNDMMLSDFETVKACLSMFLYMNVEKIFIIPHRTLCQFILSVKKNYRPVEYHNWRHGLNVAQTMFTILSKPLFNTVFDNLEKFALLVACLCHDLDHRGTNNAFQSEMEHPLAYLYSTSTLEHHHFDQCVIILNSINCNIFASLSAIEYRNCLRFIEDSIIATDLAVYFQKKKIFLERVNNKLIQFKDKYDVGLLRDMMMTACDLAGICKPWEIQIKIAEKVASEMFQQGDIERVKLGLLPSHPMMDRNKKKELPKMQVGFIEMCGCPVYKSLSDLEPLLLPLYHGCLANRVNWMARGSINFYAAPGINTKEEIVMQSRKHEEIKRTLLAEKANKQQNDPARQTGSRESRDKSNNSALNSARHSAANSAHNSARNSRPSLPKDDAQDNQQQKKSGCILQ